MTITHPNSQLGPAWNDLIRQQGPYRYFVTVTFKYDLAQAETYRSLNYLIHILNRKIFGSRYRTRNQHLAGFCFTETHKDRSLHFHLLIQDDPQLAPADKLSFRQHLIHNLDRVRKFNRTTGRHTYPVLDQIGIDVQGVYDDNVISYCTKSMHSANDDFIQPLTLDGVAN